MTQDAQTVSAGQQHTGTAGNMEIRPTGLGGITSPPGATFEPEGAGPPATAAPTGAAPQAGSAVGQGGSSQATGAAAEGAHASASRKDIDWSKPRVAAILGQAARSFARDGFESTTAIIARQIGVPKSIIYHYFVDKQQLIREVQRYVYGKHLERVRGAVSQLGRPSGAAALQALEALWKERRARDLRFELGVLSAMRHDPRLVEEACKLRAAQRELAAEVVARAFGIDGASVQRTEPLTSLVAAAMTGLAVVSHVEGDEGPASRAQQILVRLLELGVAQFGVEGETTIREACDSEPPPAPVRHDGVGDDRISAGF